MTYITGKVKCSHSLFTVMVKVTLSVNQVRHETFKLSLVVALHKSMDRKFPIAVNLTSNGYRPLSFECLLKELFVKMNIVLL